MGEAGVSGSGTAFSSQNMGLVEPFHPLRCLHSEKSDREGGVGEEECGHHGLVGADRRQPESLSHWGTLRDGPTPGLLTYTPQPSSLAVGLFCLLPDLARVHEGQGAFALFP